MQILKLFCGGSVGRVILEIHLENMDSPLLVTTQVESPRQDRLDDSRLAMTQVECALCMFDGLIEQALTQASVREHGMRTPGSRFGFNRAVEVLSRPGRFVFPHESSAQREQGAQMVWSEDEDFFPIALGLHPIVHLRGINSKKEIGVRVIRSQPINRIQVAARLSRLVG